ncbi:hypothetical protein LSAT2_015752 [Lamellibrachia satsuma]|nr:hypothetical protein LSAT2_015752 [Lamellibrachia satsuma]
MCFLVVCMMSYIGLGHTANKKLCGRALPRAVYVVCGMMKRGGAPTVHQRPSAPVLNDNVARLLSRYRTLASDRTWSWSEHYHARHRRSALGTTADRCCLYGCSIKDLARVC